MNVIQSLKYFTPELLLTVLIVIAVLADLIFKKENRRRSTAIVITGAFVVLVSLFLGSPDNHSIFFGTVVKDGFAVFFKALAMVALIFTLWGSRHSKDLSTYSPGEFNSLMLMIILGIFVLAGAVDLLLIYLSFELLSLLSYVLSGYLLKDKRSNEAALKYLIFGAFSSGVMLFGMSWLYGLTGSLKLDHIHHFLSNYSDSILPVYISMLMVLAGISYKIAAVPFHFWSPDVYEGSPTPFTAFLSVAPKAAGFALMIRIFSYTFSGEGAISSESWNAVRDLDWPTLIAIISAATMTLGNVIAIQQKNVKRMLAYSSIAHAGYLMMGLVVLDLSGIFAILFYLSVYLFMNLGAFFVAVFVNNNCGKEDISDFRALGYKAPFIAVLMVIFLFSLTGLPPTAGFIGKFYLFAALINSQDQWLWLAVIGIINSVISLYYYAGIIKEMYLREEKDEYQSLKPGFSFSLMLFLLVVPIVLFGIYWTPLQEFAASSLSFFIGI